jgi:trehalose/maltose hydrolase-like predicted phosphorylase
MYTSRDGVEDPVRTALNHHTSLLTATRKAILCNSSAEVGCLLLYAHLLADNQAIWQDYWNRADIILEGDEKAQLALRYSLYQLRINVSSHDDRYSIASKGLTGFGYHGHIFQDSEIFMLPFFAYVLPDIARNLLMYRYRGLPAARKKAASYGYEGTQYPWESTLSGEETTPALIVHLETGEVIPVLNGSHELHITASIAHVVW